VRDAMVESMKEVTKITHTVQHSEIQIDDQAATLISIQQDLEESLKQYEQTLTHIRQGVHSLIEQHEYKYFTDSTDNYQQGMRCDTSAQILARKSNIDPDSYVLLESRLKTHTNWQFPGMLIRPAHNPWIESLVALDPMYLVDTHPDLFAPVTSMFTPEYQRRLRYYVIEEYTSDRIFCNLPQEQFGVVCAFNYFNFKPWEVIKQYLDEVFVLLRPGGSFLFSFNDCDNWRAVGLVEHHYCCYTPGRLLRKHVLDLGYEITNDHQTQTGPSWMEIRKPGVLDSIRGGQTLAGIFMKTVDKPVKELYNAMDQDQLIKLAASLRVDISQAKTKHEFNIKKVRNTISTHLETANYPEGTLRELFKPKEN
jgi:SAM-dependent methyltransferase